MEHLLYKDVFPAGEFSEATGERARPETSIAHRLAVLRSELQHAKDAQDQALLHYEVGHWIEKSEGPSAQAVAEYLACVNLNPAFDPAMDALVRIYEQRGSFTNLDRLYEIQANLQVSHKDVASACLDRALMRWAERRDEARVPQLLREALAQDPSSTTASVVEWLAHAYSDTTLANEAMEVRMQMAHEPRLRTEIVVQMARAAEARGEIDKALAVLQSAVSSHAEMSAQGETRWEPVAHVLYELLELSQRAGRYTSAARAAEALAEDATQVYDEMTRSGYLGSNRVRFIHFKSPDHALKYIAFFRYVAAQAHSEQYKSTADQASLRLARANIDEAVARAPEDVFLRQVRMRLCDWQQDVIAAGEDARYLLARFASKEKGPWAAAWYLRMAEVAQFRGDVDTAKRALSEGLRCAPNSVVLAGLLENLLVDDDAHGMLVEACSQQAWTLSGLEKVHALRKAAYLAWRCLGDRDTLENYLDQAAGLSSTPMDVLREQWGWRCVHGKEASVEHGTRLVRAMLEHVTEARERSALLRYAYRSVCVDLGDAPAAKSILSEIVQEALRQPSIHYAWAMRVALYEAATASDHARMAILHGWFADTVPTDETLHAGSRRQAHLCARSRAHFLAGDYVQALSVLEDVLRDSPQHPYARALFELALRKLGRNEEAARFLASQQARTAEADVSVDGFHMSQLLGALTAEVASSYDLARDTYLGVLHSAPEKSAAKLLAARGLYRTGLLNNRSAWMLEALASMVEDDPPWVTSKAEEWLALQWESPDKTLDGVLLRRVFQMPTMDQGISEWALGSTPVASEVGGKKNQQSTSTLENAWQRWENGTAYGSADAVRRWIDLLDAFRLPSLENADPQSHVFSGCVGMLSALAGISTSDEYPYDVGATHRLLGVAQKKSPTLKDRSRLYERVTKISSHSASKLSKQLRDDYAHAFVAASVLDPRPTTEGWLTYLRTQLETHKDDLALWEELRVLARRSEAWEMVVEACDALARAVPSDIAVALWLEAGVVLQEKLGRPEDAVTRLERLLRVEPKHKEAFGVVHDAWMDLGDTRNLIACVQRRCDVIAGDSEAHGELIDLRIELGRLYQVLGEREHALAVLQLNLDQDENHIETLMLTADIHFSHRQWQEGAAVLGRILRQDNISESQRFEISLKCATTLGDKAGRYTEATQVLDQIASRLHDDARDDARLDHEFWTLMARYREQAGRYNEAAHAWRQAASVAPAETLRHVLLQRAEGLERALNVKLSDKALRLRCEWMKSPSDIQSVQLYLNEIHEPMERSATFDEYERFVRAELALDVTEPEALRKLGHVATWQGQRDTVLAVMEVMAALGVMSREEQMHYAQLPRRLPEAQWIGAAGKVFPPLADRGVGLLNPTSMGEALLTFLQKCSRALAMLDPINISGSTQRLSPKQYGALMSELELLSRPFGVEVEGAYLTDKGPTLMIPSAGRNGIRWTLGAESTLLVTGRQRFRVGKFALASAHNVIDLVARGSDETERIVLAFAMDAGHVRPDARWAKSTRTFSEWIDRGLRARDKKAIARVIQDLPSSPDFFVSAARQLHIWCASAGALTACDIKAALEEVLGATVTRLRTQGHPVAEALITFWVSDLARSVRAQLGVGV